MWTGRMLHHAWLMQSQATCQAIIQPFYSILPSLYLLFPVKCWLLTSQCKFFSISLSLSVFMYLCVCVWIRWESVIHWPRTSNKCNSAYETNSLVHCTSVLMHGSYKMDMKKANTEQADCMCVWGRVSVCYLKVEVEFLLPTWGALMLNSMSLSLSLLNHVCAHSSLPCSLSSRWCTPLVPCIRWNKRSIKYNLE